MSWKGADMPSLGGKSREMLNIHLPYVRRLITSTIQRQKLIPYTVAKGVGVGYHITSLSQTSGTFESLKKVRFEHRILISLQANG